MRPRLTVFKSNKYLYGQLIDDVKGHTLASINKVKDPNSVGEGIAQKALKLKINKAVFDRGQFRYHGKIKQIADAARKAGLSI
jgi:large subunit ribosomal protein L18